MAKVLRCPTCGAGEDDIVLRQEATVEYRIEADSTDPDGIRIHPGSKFTHEDGEWSIHCTSCGDEETGEDFTETFLVLDSVSGANT